MQGYDLTLKSLLTREAGPVFQSPEVAFRIRVVVGNARAAISFSDSQVGHEKGDRFGGVHEDALKNAREGRRTEASPGT